MQAAAHTKLMPAAAALRLDAPRLLIEWEGLPLAFIRGARAFFRPPPPPPVLTARPARFWPDVFVPQRRAFGGFAISLIYHAALVAFLSLLPTLILLSRAPLRAPATNDRSIIYYQVSEYLPPMRSKSAPARIIRKAQPRLAAQQIISVHEHADNREQTILTAPRVRILAQHVQLPNIIAATPLLAAPEALPARAPKMIFPFAPPTVVPPVAKVSAEDLAKVKLPKLPSARVVQPAPDLNALPSKLSPINIAPSERVKAPALAEIPQHTTAAAAQSQTAKTQSQPPSTPAISAGLGTKSQGQLLALNLDPAVATGPVDVPPGQRQGNFALGPEGKPDAPGTPAQSESSSKADAGAGNGASGSGTGEPNLSAAGISIGAPPANAAPLAAGAPIIQAPQPQKFEPQKIARVETPPPPPAREAPPEIEDTPEGAVFGVKKYYSLTLNMPNLTSAGGSWVIRFAQLGDNDAPGVLSAPIPLEKFDPAYPPDLMADHVEGTVILYAVIHADGSVAGVRVLQSVDDRLDANARQALLRWRFQPGTLNGTAVALEAVVRIPFKVRHASY